jgi:hypothetical protein
MPVDQEIRRLAADPEVVATIKTIDCFFKRLAEQCFVADTAEEVIEDCWRLMKRGILRLYDPEVDDDDPFVQETVTPAERARARIIGARLFAIRQHIRRAAQGKPTHLGYRRGLRTVRRSASNR